MSFSPDWLSLRASADRQARNVDLAADLAEAVHDFEALRVVDLGSGTGANMAALAPLLGRNQTWVLTDNDADLLDRVEPESGIKLERQVVDLSGDLVDLLAPVPDLVTASAFFDLCSADLIDRLVTRIAHAGAIFYTVLTYDGREEWTPLHPLDEAVLAAFHGDQTRDKGLGPALGPGATEYLAKAFKAAGYSVKTGPSDWQLTASDDAELIGALARGSADAVAGVLGSETAADWQRSRADAASVMIGHQDLIALPPG